MKRVEQKDLKKALRNVKIEELLKVEEENQDNREDNIDSLLDDNQDSENEKGSNTPRS